jgi:hypothetical protein
MRRIATRHGPTPGGRQQSVDALAPVLRRLDGASRDVLIERTARVLRVSTRAVREKVGRNTPTQRIQPPPTRWDPSPRLRTLMWLMLHYPGEVAEELIAFPNPEWLTDNTEALRAIAMLLSGAGLPEVMETISDVDVSRLLRIEATHNRGYEPASARQETLTFLRDLRIQDLDRELFALQQQIDGAFNAGQHPREALLRRQAIQKQLRRLRQGKTWRLDEEQVSPEETAQP